jgi:hypothetical protein
LVVPKLRGNGKGFRVRFQGLNKKYISTTKKDRYPKQNGVKKN